MTLIMLIRILLIVFAVGAVLYAVRDGFKIDDDYNVVKKGGKQPPTPPPAPQAQLGPEVVQDMRTYITNGDV